MTKVAPQVRITLTPGVANTTADVSGVTNIYATPVDGCRLPIHDGSRFRLYTVASDLALALDNNSGHVGYHQAGKNFDLFAVLDGSGAARVGTGPDWTAGANPGSNILRGTGVGSTEIHLVNGIWTNANAITIRYGSASGSTMTVAANCATYIGSFRPIADGQAGDTALKRLVFNAWQIAQRCGLVQEAGTNWDHSASSFRQVNSANVGAANQVETLFGLPSVLMTAEAFNVVQNSTTTPRTVAAGIGIDSTTVNSGRSTFVQCTNSPIVTCQSFYKGYPGLGWHQIIWQERGAGVTPDTQTWYGNNAGAAVHRSGLQLEFWG
jgi:hypothetical protein